MAADYMLRMASGAVAKSAIDIVVTRTAQNEARGSRKLDYLAFLANSDDSPLRLGGAQEKEIRIRIPEEAKPSFANRFLYSPQRFLMLRARLEGGRAYAINANEDNHGETPDALLQAVFKAVCRDLEGEGAVSINVGKLRSKGRHGDVPFSKIEPLVDARIRASGYVLE